jgi:hypothetical protein
MKSSSGAAPAVATKLKSTLYVSSSFGNSMYYLSDSTAANNIKIFNYPAENGIAEGVIWFETTNYMVTVGDGS